MHNQNRTTEGPRRVIFRACGLPFYTVTRGVRSPFLALASSSTVGWEQLVDPWIVPSASMSDRPLCKDNPSGVIARHANVDIHVFTVDETLLCIVGWATRDDDLVDLAQGNHFPSAVLDTPDDYRGVS